MNVGIQLSTRYEVDCHRSGVLLWHDGFNNIVVTVGKNKVLDAMFLDGIGALAWYVGLVATSGFTAYNVANTMSSHAGWTELASYAGATRRAYTPAAAASASMSNVAARAQFTINTTTNVKGAFLVNNSTKSGSTGTLYGVGSFSSDHAVIAGDVLSVKITLTAA